MVAVGWLLRVRDDNGQNFLDWLNEEINSIISMTPQLTASRSPVSIRVHTEAQGGGEKLRCVVRLISFS
jgi:hypothetical protein